VSRENNGGIDRSLLPELSGELPLSFNLHLPAWKGKKC
jgi:hypothetical protein